MGLETSIQKFCIASGMALNGAAPKEIKNVIKSRSIWGGIVLVIPLFGLDTIIYSILLWSMYASISRIAGIKFSGALIKNVLGGFIVNILITFVINFFADFIYVIGWIGMFFVGYFATKLSGIAYLGVLEAFHGRQKMKVRLDYEKMKQKFNEAGGKGATKGIARNGVSEIGGNILS